MAERKTYVSLETLKQLVEDVEVNGRWYRIRALSPAEVMEVERALPVLVDAGAKGARPGTETEARALLARYLIAGLVEPKVDEATVGLIPIKDCNELVGAIRALSGLGLPFDGDAGDGSS